MQIEQMFLDAISEALHDGKVCWTEVSEEQWTKLMSLSAIHKVQPLVLNAVFDCPAASNWTDYSSQKRYSKVQLLTQTLKTAEFRELYAFFQSNGIRPLVVKGILCRSVYPNQELRQSADEDLLVPEELFESCCALLRQYGFFPTSENADPDAYEIGWRKPNSLLYIELHKSLFSPDSSAVKALQFFFTNAFESAQKYLIDGDTFFSLCPHDHFLYLILHAYKHFIHSGFGIRQICDIGLWAKAYAEDINWQALYKQCQEVRALKFAAAVLDVAERYLKIDFSLPLQWKELQVDSAPLLIDSLRAGIYGSSDPSRAHSASVIFNSVAAERNNKRSSLLQTIFPNKKKLENHYPILKKSGMFLPAVWCARLWKYRKETKASPDNQVSEALRIAKERKQLLQYYEIIDS